MVAVNDDRRVLQKSALLQLPEELLDGFVVVAHRVQITAEVRTLDRSELQLTFSHGYILIRAVRGERDQQTQERPLQSLDARHDAFEEQLVAHPPTKLRTVTDFV